jgi:putative peptide zinc metalloprotease protein
VLQLRSSGISFESIAEQFNRQPDQNVTPDEVEAAYQQVIERVEEIEENAESPRPGFLFHFSILPEKLVAKVASYLSIAFHPIVALCLLAFIIVTIGISLRRDFASLNFAPRDFWLGYALLLASTLMHELGHASACARYGARPSSIGFTLYLIYPTFYSDVNTAWELKRWQRVVVDLGGAFLQLVVGAGYALAYTLSGWEPLRVALLMIFGNLVFSLNPIFRFDGYWVIADALGVTNLGQQPRRIFRHFLARLRGQTTKPLPWPTPVKLILLPYTLISFAFWGFFIWRIVPFMWQQIATYPNLVVTLINDLLDPSKALHVERFQSLLMSTYMVIIGLLMVWRLGAPLLAAARSKALELTRKERVNEIASALEAKEAAL